MHELQYQIMLIKSSIRFTMQQLWHLQGLPSAHEDVRGCLMQLKKYRRELKAKENMLASLSGGALAC